MSDFTEDTLSAQPMIDLDQWSRLINELGKEMLLSFAQEYFEETREIWYDEALDPMSMEPAAFRSMSHRSAGAAGTIGFKKLRHAFLCMEHNEMGPQTFKFIELMKEVFEDTESWVKTQ